MSYPEHQAHAQQAQPRVRVGILTASDSRGPERDESGALIHFRIKGDLHEIVGRRIVKDSIPQLRKAADELFAMGTEVLIVNGGTGITPRDVTIEAFQPWFQKELPGFGERFRQLSVEQVGSGAWLSRATAATVERNRKVRLLFLLPGSPDACRLAVEQLILPELAHAVTLMQGEKPHA